ncbi:MAG: thylakoid membrane photosystem I accumulation factor [Cyanobacteriota bacterium]|nr:thylakoid membrane photosystem I accumulation factor [Cyanobacteriota bacterium]
MIPWRSAHRPWIRGQALLLATLVLGLLLAWPTAARASLENDRYDGNIFALYAGNGSLVPPRLSLADALKDHRVTVLIYYLDDSSASKRFAGAVSELQRVWGNTIELIPLVTDPLQGRADGGPTDPLHYWRGRIPEVVVLNGEGRPVFQAAGQVDLDAIHGALSEATGLPRPPSQGLRTAVSFNELNEGWAPAAAPTAPPHG